MNYERNNIELGIEEDIDQKKLLMTRIENLTILIYGASKASQEEVDKEKKETLLKVKFQYMDKQEEFKKLYKHLYL